MSDRGRTVIGMATRRPAGMPADSELWTAPDGGRWLLTVTAWAVVDGRTEPVGVELRSVRRSGDDRDEWARGVLPPNSRHDDGRVRGREPLPITTRTWRAPPLADLLATIRARAAEHRAASHGEGAAGVRAWRAPKRRRGAVTQADVVEVYLAAREAGLPPSKTVADELRLSRDAAYQRVRRARDAGLLPPTDPGRASGGAASDERPGR